MIDSPVRVLDLLSIRRCLRSDRQAMERSNGEDLQDRRAIPQDRREVGRRGRAS